MPTVASGRPMPSAPISGKVEPARTGPPTVWHGLTPAEAMDRAATGPDGLDEAEASRRLGLHGPNALADQGSAGPLALLWQQLTAVMVLILIGAALVSLGLGKYLEAGSIGAIVVLFALLGFVQEYRAERAIAALRRLSVPVVRVVRDGGAREVPAGDLVPGDIVLLEAGSVVPADLRLTAGASLRIQESALTGESEPVDKEAELIIEADASLGDRRNMAYSGTQVTYGRGRGLVVATGMATELGRIADLLQGVTATATPLQARLDRVGKQLAVVGVVVAILVVAMGLVAGEPLSDLLLTAISVAVAVIPEGLPAVVTFTLAIGAQRMLRRNALVRKLPAVETLGSVTVICSDKTGTLTQNRMTAVVVEVAGQRLRLDQDPFLPGLDQPGAGSDSTGSLIPVRLTLAAGSLCNDSEPAAADPGAVLGDPTEVALLVAAERAGIDVVALRGQTPRVAELPFDSDRKRMSTVHGPLGPTGPEALKGLPQDQPVALVKGAPDGLLALADTVWDGDQGGPTPLDDQGRARIRAANDELAAGGMRVLAVAYRTLPLPFPGDGPPTADEIENGLTMLGLVGIIDPPRPEVAEAVATCTTAGIRTVMITGDHPLTARAVATELGIGTDPSGSGPDGDGHPYGGPGGGNLEVVAGADLDGIDDDALDGIVQRVGVFARVSPTHKLRIVASLQRQGAVVAMTGDGVNDAPALKRADIGVAMGVTGTEVSKEASDMVLRDDNFATIVAAVEEGRVIYDNLRRFVKFAVAGNIGKIAVMLVWPVPLLFTGGDMGDAVALLPLQLLWLNLMTDGLLGLSLGLEPAERGVMRRPPHAPGSSIWSGGLGRQTAWTGLLIGAAALAVGLVYHALDRPEWQTMLFTTLAFLQLFQAFATRSSTETVLALGLRSNPLVAVIGGLVAVLQLAAIYTPLRGFLDLEPLGAGDLAVAIGAGAALVLVLDGEKVLRRRRSPVALNGPERWSPTR